jgi:acyl carrier protein
MSVSQLVYAAVRATAPDPANLRDELSFVEDLGYDSLRVAALAVALENQLGRPVLLNDWLASAEDPAILTVESLVRYVQDLFEGGV